MRWRDWQLRLGWPSFVAGCALLSLGQLHCGDSSNDSGEGGGSGGTSSVTGGTGGGDSGSNGGSGGGGGVGGQEPPPEQELESSFKAPVATGRYVWTANPDSGRVALIDALSFEVQVVEAGFQPTYLAAVSKPQDDRDVAIVLNTGSLDATLFSVRPDGIDSYTAKVHRGANAWALSPSGRWAVAWTDYREVTNLDPTDGFQDLTLLDLSTPTPTPTRLSVGFRPTRLFFDGDEDHVFVVTEPGISTLELGDSPSVGLLIPLDQDQFDSPTGRDVTVTPDGAHAFVRREGSPTVEIINLADGARSEVTFSAAVTDLDLTVDGTRGVAVVRSSSEVVLFDVAEILADTTNFNVVPIAGSTVGSVSLPSDARRALLYSNATGSDRVVVLNLEPGEHFLEQRTIALKAPVLAVFPTEDAAHAVSLMTRPTGSNKAGAFGVIPVDTALAPKIVGTDAAPQQVAVSPDGTRAVVTVRDDNTKVFGAYLARMPSLQVDYQSLSSPPLAVGVVPAADRAFISQSHPEGRITFIDFKDGSSRTLTGFELGAKVVD
ncbi:MAG: hypothetical protein H6718_06820 [Polyangiaceae bacterium]|nr:hypothetical protein [Myxococcales bacterium]MCB9585091.1 hypothetical protein [Polyangiaceae bacterium]